MPIPSQGSDLKIVAPEKDGSVRTDGGRAVSDIAQAVGPVGGPVWRDGIDVGVHRANVNGPIGSDGRRRELRRIGAGEINRPHVKNPVARAVRSDGIKLV